MKHYRGIVGKRQTLKTKDGRTFVKASIQGTEEEVVGLWWDADQVPPEGAEVSVSGNLEEWDGQAELHVSKCRVVSADFGPIQRILHYYIDVIQLESAKLFQQPTSFLITDGAAPGFFAHPQPFHPLAISSTQGKLWSQKKDLCLGWPLVRLDKGDYSPLFVISIRLKWAEEQWMVHLNEGGIHPNSYALARIGLTPEQQDVFLAQFRGEFGWTGVERLETALIQLKKEKFLKGAFDPQKLSSAKPRAKVSNSALLLCAKEAIAFHGLANELRALANKTEAELQQSLFSRFFGFRKPQKISYEISYPLLNSSNVSQQQATNMAFQSSFSTVTGPPGTGKSQVLLNTAATAVLKGEKVLVAAKNNQALDVLVERLRVKTPHVLMMRLGRRDLRADLQDVVQQWSLMTGAIPRKPKKEMESTAFLTLLSQATTRVELEEELQRILPMKEELLEITPSFLFGAKGLSELSEFVESLIQKLKMYQKAGADLVFEQRFKQGWVHIRRYWPGELPQNGAVGHLRQVRNALQQHQQLESIIDQIHQIQVKLNSLPTEKQLAHRMNVMNPHRVKWGVHLFSKHWKQLRKQGKVKEFVETFVQAENKAYFQACQKGLQVLPLWGVTSLAARSNLPLEQGIFDLLIIDEASQSDIPSVLPLIWRAKRVMIIGDQQQLPHIANISQKEDKEISDQWNIPSAVWSKVSYVKQSLFDIAASHSQPTFLAQHYRCLPSIVGFSNRLFYGKRLQTVRAEADDVLPIRWLDVRGEFTQYQGKSALNTPEAELVIAVIMHNWSKWQAKKWTVGVVTPFRGHAEYIRSKLVEQQSLTDNIVVDTAHRFQGDQCDLMLFSPVISPAMPEQLVTFAETPQLLNVALTRAKQRLFIIGDAQACAQRGTILKKLLRYVDRVSESKWKQHD